MEDSLTNKVSGINSLIRLVETLRGENGCPWDKKQTSRTIAVYLLEEIYELIDAIDSGSLDEICEELGDVLFHILFIARIFEEMGHFDINNVAIVNREKMVRRHPHVFGNDHADSADEVKQSWHRIKMKEKNHAAKKSALDSVPTKLPALMRAYRISERAARTGFDWNDISGVMQKVEEEWSELKSELAKINQTKEDQNKIALELGDILFTLVNVARFVHIHPETALSASIKKFEKRFKHMENLISVKGKNFESISQNEMNILWEDAKKLERC